MERNRKGSGQMICSVRTLGISGLRGSAVSWEIAEGMLHFYITYCALQKKSADLVYMEGAEITAGTSKDRPGTDE